MSFWQVSGGDRGRFSELEPMGVIDIGSNTVRLVVYEGAVRAPTPLFNEKVLCGLGKSVATTGMLGRDGIERAVAALRRFRAVARALGVKHMRAVATAAVRDASNGADFISRAEQACGAAIQVLSGEREAELAAQGILMGFGPVDAMAGDLGGGSLELIDIQGTHLKQATTMPLGHLRLRDVTGDRQERAIELADEHIGKVSFLAAGKGRPFYAVGGAWRSLARLHMIQTEHPLRVMHGYAIGTREAVAFCETVRKRKLSTIPGIEEISKARREGLAFGAIVLERLLRRLEPSQVIFSVFGIREGLLYSLLPPHEREKDPLLSFCEDYARLRSRSVKHAHELIKWTDRLFEEPGPKETPDERRLRHAACLVSDIGWRAHPDYRGEQSLNVIAHAAMSGVDHPGRIFLALTVYFRHVGAADVPTDELSTKLKKRIDRRAFRRARIIGAAVRTAHMISIGRPGIIDETPVFHDKGRLVLRLPPAHAAMDGERLRRRFAALAELMEREPAVIVG